MLILIPTNTFPTYLYVKLFMKYRKPWADSFSCHLKYSKKIYEFTLIYILMAYQSRSSTKIVEGAEVLKKFQPPWLADGENVRF